MSEHRVDVLVIGGGPAGAAAGYWLAEAGHEVLILEKKLFPRDKTCGDGLTPRAVHQLDEMGLTPQLELYHRYDGLRAIAHGKTLEMQWPEHPVLPQHGYVVKRAQLDQMVAEHAEKSGAQLWTGAEATTPIVESGLVVGATVKHKDSDKVSQVHAKYIVVADGSLSRFGRALGAARNRSYPQGMAIRAYFESPMHDDPWIESALDLRDKNGKSLPGYGWVFPLGDGTINVGVGLLSTFRDYKSVNTSHLMKAWVDALPDHWQVSAENQVTPATGGRLPMGGSVNPKVGPTHLLVGDAAGMVNPFNGEGIDYAYETGRMAAGVLDQALRTGNGLVLQSYAQRIDDEYEMYFKVARLFAYVIGRPKLIAQLTRVGMQSRTLMEWVLRIMANLMRPDETGVAEAAYKAAAALVRFVPEKSA
jgi:menaquinone-9 beta-reductase